jgi:hypothetical protein
MIETKKVLGKLEETAAHYEAELDKYDMEQLTRSPGEEEWSLGQVYKHLIGTALYMHLAKAAACADECGDASGEAASAGKTEAGKALFALGSFPPIAVRVPPSPQYTPPQPQSKEELLQGLQQVKARMREVEPMLASIPPERTRAHPRLGALTALEWFAMVEMHFRHHLLQKAKLDAFLGVEAAAD